MGAEVSTNGRTTTNNPTNTDVLLGRGVATSRHPGNERFRTIVSQHVNAYVTSTKKQKMMISRSIFDKICNDLNPPGRFLAKNAETGLWHMVDNKRALEKTAQALRDGAATLRKQLSEDIVGALLDGKADSSGDIFLSLSSTQPPVSEKKCKKHQRTKTAPPIALSPSDTYPPRQKRQCSDAGIGSPVKPDPTQMCDRHPNNSMYPVFQSQQQIQSVYHQVPLRPQLFSPLTAPSKVNLAMPQDSFSASGISTEETSMNRKIHNSSMSSLAPPSTDSVKNNNAGDSVTASINNREATDEEEFAKEMGPDEHFLGLCNSDPIGDEFSIM